MAGRFITFEGGEGAGKSVQVKLLSEYLTKHGANVICTREPGGTEVGKQIRKLLVEGNKDKFDELTEILLFYADRRIDITKVILPALNENKYVLADRFNDSTIAYQYYGANKFKNTQIMDLLYQLVGNNLTPDLTFLLDIDVKIGLERSFHKATEMTNKELRFENVDIAFHERLRQGYLDISKKHPSRFVIINANQSIDKVHQDILTAFLTHFQNI